MYCPLKSVHTDTVDTSYVQYFPVLDIVDTKFKFLNFGVHIRERSLFTAGGGGAMQIRKSRALKICSPPSELVRYVFAPPPRILRTKILPPSPSASIH